MISLLHYETKKIKKARVALSGRPSNNGTVSRSERKSCHLTISDLTCRNCLYTFDCAYVLRFDAIVPSICFTDLFCSLFVSVWSARCEIFCLFSIFNVFVNVK